MHIRLAALIDDIAGEKPVKTVGIQLDLLQAAFAESYVTNRFRVRLQASTREHDSKRDGHRVGMECWECHV